MATIVRPIPVTLKVPPRMHQRMHEMGRTLGYTGTQYAELLLNAAFAARVGQERGEEPSDRELDEQVKLVFACGGQGNTAAIARATGVPEHRVVKILEAWRTLKNERKQP
jgi:hypothetical protein